jgi:MFS transporter, FHS family, L-fucose permease
VAALSSHAGVLTNWLSGWLEVGQHGLAITNKGASNLASVAFVSFLAVRFGGAAMLRKFSAHRVLGLYGILNVAATLVVFAKLGWFSVACVFLSYFLMSITFLTIFALGIHRLRARAKKASSFIVMAIIGGAILAKLMGAVADRFDMSRGFIVPAFCLVFVAFYGFSWPKRIKAERKIVPVPSPAYTLARGTKRAGMIIR